MTAANGTIITFYSYKGGTGRSMALANVAWILASAGRRVLTIDWDFEAPGLHRYFRPFLIDKELSSTQGLIDFFWQYAAQSVTPVDHPDGDSGKAWWDASTDLDHFTVQLDWPFKNDGCVDFIPAGKQDPEYADRVTGFDWTKFYRRLNGAVFLDSLARRLRDSYDFVLIDSRTGVSDTAGISTIAMPDSLVAMCTLNRQSVDGVAAVLASIEPQRVDRPLKVFPVFTRVELAEKDRLDAARKRARAVFAKYAPADAGNGRASYWNDMEVLYQPYYASEEVLAPFGDPSGEGRSPNSMLAAMERLTTRISGIQEVNTPFVPEAQRRTVVQEYSQSPATETTGEPVEDSDERRFRVEKYFVRDLEDPVERFAARAGWANRVSWTTTLFVLAAGIVVPIAIAVYPSAWPSLDYVPTQLIVLLSVLTVMFKSGEYLVRAPMQRLAMRLGTAAALLGNGAMNAWVAGLARPETNFGATAVVVACGFALIVHLLSAIRRLPEMGEFYARAADALRQEQRLYVNNAGEYSPLPAAPAWRQFVERIESILSRVSDYSR
jgi:MinD-like ATPase involved in chromosome partitioning or flagellar assembly